MLQKYIKHKLTEVKRKIRQIHNYIWRFRHSSLSTDKIIHREPADTEDLKSSINQVDRSPLGNYSFLREGVGGVDTTLDTWGCLDSLAASGMTCSVILTEVNQT